MLRSEFKYFVPIAHLEKVRAFLQPYMKTDQYAAKKKSPEYTVRSIYLDTPDFHCYWSKIDGLKHRYKLRIRGYNTHDRNSKVFLEIKKKYEQPIFKNRAPLKYKKLAALFRGEKVEDIIQNTQSFPNAVENAQRFFYHLYSKNMRPVTCVIYEREAYESRFPDNPNNLRITLDKNLRATAYPTVEELFSEDRLQWILRSHFILEIKFNQHRPQWIQPMLEALNLRREAASKYCLSIEKHPSINPKAGLDTFSYGRFLNNKR